jgi:hypothetical protein
MKISIYLICATVVLSPLCHSMEDSETEGTADGVLLTHPREIKREREHLPNSLITHNKQVISKDIATYSNLLKGVENDNGAAGLMLKYHYKIYIDGLQSLLAQSETITDIESRLRKFSSENGLFARYY